MEPMRKSAMHYVLWIVQILLALLFTFAGGVKLAMPIATLAEQAKMPGLFLQFISVCEILGALGLILPRLFRIRPGLTSLAASGMVIIMIGATVTTVPAMGVAPALIPFATGLLCIFVAYGRLRLAPITPRG
jgi:hypothetical protein